jgi:hypothetical protein
VDGVSLSGQDFVCALGFREIGHRAATVSVGVSIGVNRGVDK